MFDPTWGGKREGAGRPRQRLTLDIETARYLRAIQRSLQEKDLPMTAEEIVRGMIRADAHKRGWLLGGVNRAEFDRLNSGRSPKSD